MIGETFRSFLYPIGFLASTLFAARVLMQWISSEKKKKSHVTSTFWHISLSANLIMMIHSFIQLQYPICIIQALNGFIAWRNLNIMRKNCISFRATLFFMGAVFIGVTSLFILQGWWLQTTVWMRLPSFPWEKETSQNIFWMWHVLGIVGMTLFASRFWVQWWLAEKHKASILGKSFWWISLFGSLASLLYFYRLHDLVNLLSYSTGLIPYLRNLILLKKHSNPKPQAKGSIFVFAGEQSGDLIGGGLLKALKEKNPNLHVYGVGGSQMRKEGLECILQMEKFQVMGFTSVLKASPRLFKHFRNIKKIILKDQPEAVICIDYPDFNMLLEKALRKKGYQGKLIHYVCPSVWAWRKSRVGALAKTVDLLLSILPFEKECFSKTSLPVSFVGHPLVAEIDSYTYDPDWTKGYNFSSTTPLLALFPGSRPHEIEENLPIQLKAAEQFCTLHPEMAVAISCARPELNTQILALTKKSPLSPPIVPAFQRYDLMKASTLAFATSGTVNLELALHNTPTVVTYHLNALNYFLGRYFFRIRLPHYCIVNIILKRTVFPECYARSPSPEWIFQEAKTLFNQSEACKKSCDELKALLEKSHANRKAAEKIFQLMELKT